MTLTLTEEAVTAHLREGGVLAADQPARVDILPGGVSSATFLVTTGDERLVVKQPLPYLAVADVWPARLERAGVEAAAIHLLEKFTPDHLPRLLDYDADRHVIVMTAAPAAWAEWRSTLLRGNVSVGVGATLGRVLGSWHAATRRDAEARTAFADLSGFLELRGDPYHRTVAARRPDLAVPVMACLDELVAGQVCVVHGDFSPKNVLAGPDADSLWVLDFEVAHAGNPVFDVAFLLHHLVMKAVHVAGAGEALHGCARAFVDGYAAAGGLATDGTSVVRHTGALLLARVHGKSPTAYLTPVDQERVSAIGARAVRGELDDVTVLFDAATGPAR